MKTALKTDVVIVGGGPVGITLSIALSNLGLENVVVEREPEPFPLPRAIVMDAEIHRSLMRQGLGSALAERLTPMLAADFVDAAGTRLMGIDLDGIKLFGVPAVSRHYQPELEVMLREEAERRGASIRKGVSATSLHDDGSSVSISCDDDTVIDSRFLVGCDGASSFVRKSAGIPLEDLGFDQDWLVVDLLVPDKASSGLPDVTRQVCDPLRPTTLVSGHRDYYRFEFQLQPGEVPALMRSEEHVWKLLSPWISPSRATVIRSATYRFHAVVATTMRTGNVFIAGDAAHQMPPFMGQGLNSGMRDAFNLAWKLSFVARGVAEEGLLDTYSAERLPHARGTVAESVETGRLIDQLAGRTSHGVSSEAGYGGSRRSLAFTTGALIEGGAGVGAPFGAMEVLPPETVGSFSVVTHASLAELDGDPILRGVVADPGVLLSDEVVFVRPDGYVGAVCKREQAVHTWRDLKKAARLTGV
ncbi:MAG: bifunctional 3-(3-hydroxy-phenyl)propionate/3-hydroxycinnamic acid hydroxylase [Ilumatobacteraceae bacterium]